MEQLEFSLSLTPAEYARAIRANAVQQPIILAMAISFSLIGICALYNFFIQAGNSIESYWSTGKPSYFGCALIAFFIPVILFGFGPIQASRRLAKRQKSMGLITWTLADDHIKVADAKSKSEMQWSVFGRVRETKYFYFMDYRLNKKVFHIIPRRAFSTPQEEALFRGLVEKHIGPMIKQFWVK